MVLHGIRAALTGTDAQGIVNRNNENLAVADATGMRRVANGLDSPVDEIVFGHELDLHLGQEIYNVFSPAIEFRVALLMTESLDLRHGQALQPGLVQGLLDLVELERLDHRLDLLHDDFNPDVTRQSCMRTHGMRATHRRINAFRAATTILQYLADRIALVEIPKGHCLTGKSPGGITVTDGG